MLQFIRAIRKTPFRAFCPFLNLFQEGDSQHVMSEL